MTIKQLTLSFYCISMLSGCGIARNLASTLPIAPSISFRSIAPLAGEYSNLGGNTPRGFRIQSQEELHDALNSHLDEIPGMVDRKAYVDGLVSRLPVIDFTKDQGVLFLFGSQSSGGYEGKIAAIEEKSDRFVVHPILWTPSSGMTVTATVTYPYHYVAMPRSEKPMEFAPRVKREQPGPWYAISSVQ
ncbi:protease complex subunit PrcB family protein [bacterium]|nr:protease complex subunit PrcB family protein [bacterium]